MDDNENLETLAATDEELQPSADEVMDEDAVQDEAETNKEPETPAVDEEKEALKAQLQREKDARNGVKADKNLLAKTLKAVMDDYGLTEEEAAKYAGIAPNDLKARIANLETSDDPIAAFSASFDDLYVGKGHKAVLDEVYGTDTQAYVNAFAKFGLNDPDLQQEILSMEPAKALTFVVKQGKELLEEVGGADVSLRKLAKENAALKAKLAKLEGGAGEEERPVQKTTKTPLSGFAGSVSNGGSAGKALLPAGMF